MPTADQLIESGRKHLLNHVDKFSRVGDERDQATELLAYAAGREITDGIEVDPRTAQRYERFLERRSTGEPVPYIRGFETFSGLKLAVKPGVFIPRDSTQFLAKQAVARLRGRKNPVGADLATGVGAVALAMADAVPSARVYGTDLAPLAVRLARANARANRLPNARFVTGSMFDPLPRALRGGIDVIASHPPYVATDELDDLPAEIGFEPTMTITDSSSDGLGLVRLLIDEGREWLKRDGWMCIEIAPDLARPVRTMLSRAGYRNVKSTRGIHEYSRVLVAKR
ncbi:MAG: HemK/PrmC family methyltransferase [Actinomycetota bacterium]